MNQFLAYFARRDFLARIITIMILLVGLGALSLLKLQELPDVAFAEVTINTQYPGASAQDIELNITNKIEKELKSVQGLKKYNSRSFDGQSQITIEIDDSHDLDKVIRDIQQAVDRVSGLPKDITNPPRVEQKNTSSFKVMSFGVITDQNNHALQSYARELEKRLLNVSGVGSIQMSGFTEREFWIEIDPDKISRYKLTVDHVISAINARNLSLSGGAVESWESEQRIVTLTQVTSTQELADTIIALLPSGELVRLADVATVSDTFEKATQLGMVDGQQGIIFSISKSANADILATIDSVKALLDAEYKSVHGKFSFPISLNLAEDMNDKFTIVTTNGGVGLILVLIVLSMILRRQVAFWVAVSIPFCILGVIAVLPILGMNLDSITLAALLLVLGIIVDDSVIVAESIYQEREQGKPALEAAISGVQAVFVPIIASLSTTALVFIPMFFLPGSLGKAIIVIPITVLTALLFSLIECTFTLPAHLTQALKKAFTSNKQGFTERLFNRLINQYQALLTLSIKWHKRVLFLAVIALVGSIGLLTNLKIDFFPSDAAKYIEIYTEIAPGTPLNHVQKAHVALEKAIATLPDSELAAYQMTYASPVSTGLITLTNFEQRQRTATEIAEQLNEKTKTSESIKFAKFTVDAGGPPSGEPVEIRVISNNQQAREQAVTLVMDWMQAYKGLDKVTHNEVLTDPQLSIIPQYEWLARYHLTVQDLASTLRIAFDGENVTSTWIGDQEVDLRVLLDKEHRNIDKLKTTKIYTPSGLQVPLSRLAKIVKIQAPREILHYKGERQVLIRAQIIDDNLSATEMSHKLTSALENRLPASVRLDIGGEAENTDETLSGFLVAFPSAMIGIYFVLAIMFGSLTQPLLIMSVIPFAIAAAFMALFIHMQPLSLFALVGVLGMTGVVVNNSLVLINRINELRNAGQTATEAIIHGAVSRFRPILITSLTTIVGLLPLAYGIGGTDVYMGPMSLTLGYGLMLSLPVVLIIIPCLYRLCFCQTLGVLSRKNCHDTNKNMSQPYTL